MLAAMYTLHGGQYAIVAIMLLGVLAVVVAMVAAPHGEIKKDKVPTEQRSAVKVVPAHYDWSKDWEWERNAKAAEGYVCALCGVVKEECKCDVGIIPIVPGWKPKK